MAESSSYVYGLPEVEGLSVPRGDTETCVDSEMWWVDLPSPCEHLPEQTLEFFWSVWDLLRL